MSEAVGDAGGLGGGATGESVAGPGRGGMVDELGEIEIIEPLCAVFRRSLKAEGLKYTPERAHILDTIIRLEGVFEAETLLERVRADGFRVSKATIYRTLRLLEDAGIIQHVPVDREQSHYQLVYGRRTNTLLVNVETGEVEPIEIPGLNALRDQVCRERGLQVEGHRMHVFVRPAGVGGK